MSQQSAIEWTDATWNPVRGCTKVSPGCANCYAETFAERWRGVKGHAYEQGFDLRLVPQKLTEPLSWKKPRRVFVNSMSDLFQDGVPDQFITDVFGVMFLAHWHTFQVLTKRPQRMLDYLSRGDHGIVQQMHAMMTCGGVSTKQVFGALSMKRRDGVALTWPPPNVWLGVSVENQHFANERIPLLLQTPAAVRFISAEPLLEPIDLSRINVGNRLVGPTQGYLDWVIVGGESGHGARPFDVAWARSIVSQCRTSGVPVFVKQLGARAFDSSVDLNAVNYAAHSVGAVNRLVYLRLSQSKGGDMAEWPEDLRVREFPSAVRG